MSSRPPAAKPTGIYGVAGIPSSASPASQAGLKPRCQRLGFGLIGFNFAAQAPRPIPQGSEHGANKEHDRYQKSGRHRDCLPDEADDIPPGHPQYTKLE